MLITEAELQELAAIDAESIGRLPLGDGAYLHIGNLDEEEVVITVTGVAEKPFSLRGRSPKYFSVIATTSSWRTSPPSATTMRSAP